MSTRAKKQDFFSSDEGILALEELKAMVSDDHYNTQASFAPNKAVYPENSISFVEKHMKYLGNHPNLSPVHYIANLKLITKVR